MDSLDTYWPEILGVVRQKVQQQTFDTWFLPLQPDGRNGNGALRVFCPNPFYLDWFSEHHLSTLNEAGSAFFGRSIDFNLAVDPLRTQGVEIFRPEKPADPTGKPVKSMISPGNSNDGNPAARLDQNLVSEVDSGHPQLNIDYTFDSFVVGSGSNLAYAAATSVAKTPGRHYNPLFIHGGSGLGKTHLLHAVGNEIRRNFPEKKICYVTAEQFMNDLDYAIQQNRQPDFKLRYRSVDVLLVDDVAFMAGKETTQEEFFHTFNALYSQKKQIVLTSDRSPKEISTIEMRLRSRFEWGLIVDIQPPNLETRIAILKRKVEINSIYITDEVVQYIAEHVTDNIRRLEGALIRLLAFASLTARDITLEMASEVLSSYFQGESAEPIRIADIQKAVAAETGYSVDQLKSKRRTQDLAWSRQVAMFFSRELTGSSLNQIGRAFGGRDHSTVAHACQKVQEMAEKDPQVRGLLKTIGERLREKR